LTFQFLLPPFIVIFVSLLLHFAYQWPKKNYVLIFCWCIISLSIRKHLEFNRLQGLLYIFLFLLTSITVRWGWEKEMLHSKFKLLGICWFVSHFSSILKDNHSFFEDRVYTSYFLLLLAPHSLPSLPFTIADFILFFAWYFFCFAN
jgi:hypothetical protein